jgi:hypothetical protein
MATIDYRSPSGPRPRRRVSILLLIGVIVLLVGCGPLFAVLLAARFGWTDDPNPNPVFLGILAMFTFYPGAALIVIGALTTLVQWRRRQVSQIQSGADHRR